MKTVLTIDKTKIGKVSFNTSFNQRKTTNKSSERKQTNKPKKQYPKL